MAKEICVLSISIMLVAMARATWHSSRSSALRAQFVATRPAEHAVSDAKLGPCNPSAKLRRPDATDSAGP
eukprot:999106-Prymnesium_polylepis.2